MAGAYRGRNYSLGSLDTLLLTAACWSGGEPCVTPEPAGFATTAALIEGAASVIATIPLGSGRSNIWVGVNPGTDRVYVSIAKDDTVYVIEDTPATPTP